MGLARVLLKIERMKKLILTMTMLVMATASFAAESSVTPESRVSTPIQSEISSKSPVLSDRDSESWARRREERRLAREQILSGVRSSHASEKSEVRGALQKNRNENSQKEGFTPKNGDHFRVPPEAKGAPRENDQRFGDVPPNKVRENGMKH